MGVAGHTLFREDAITGPFPGEGSHEVFMSLTVTLVA